MEHHHIYEKKFNIKYALQFLIIKTAGAFKNKIILKYKCIIICFLVLWTKVCNIVFKHEIVHCYNIMFVIVSDLNVGSVRPQLTSNSRVKIII